MKTTLHLVVVVEHDHTYDPANNFVWYFCDGWTNFEPDTDVIREDWYEWKVEAK